MSNTCPFAILLGGRFRWVVVVILLVAIASGIWYWNLARTRNLGLGDVVIEDIAPDGMSKYIPGSKPVILEFYTKSCPYCVKIEPELKEIKAKYGDKVLVLKMNAEVFPQEASRYEIRGVPTLVFLDQAGKPQATAAGYRDFEGIQEILQGLGFVK
ncbi:MAG: thioredoxin family protein [Bacillota bacterium]